MPDFSPRGEGENPGNQGVSRPSQAIFHPLSWEKSPQNQRYAQYIDAETAVVKRPEGPGYDDPFGDGVWRSSWFYGSLLAIRIKDPVAYNRLKAEHGVDVSQAERFLGYFRDNCTSGDEWKLPKKDDEKFSGDQLAPLLYFLANVNLYGSDESKGIAGDVLRRLLALDARRGAVSHSPQGQILDNQRYAIDAVCRMYDIGYLKGLRRDTCKIAFTAALKSRIALAQLPVQELATKEDYSVFNDLAIVTVTDLKWGKDDEDVASWRANFRLHADKGWGPAFRIVSGRSLDDSVIEAYYTAHVTPAQDNDIIMAQRPRYYLSGDFKPDPDSGPNRWLVLDYVVLKSLQLLWQ